MYKYYNKDLYKVMEYSFDSLTEFIDYLDNTPVNEKIWGRKELASETSDYDFCKTNSLEEAKQYCKYGYHRDFDKLVELKLNLEKYIKLTNTRQKQYNYYVGYAPDVKSYLEGNPLSMFNRENPKRKQIDIYYNSAILSNVSANTIFNRGAITLCLIEILENLGYSVNLNVFTMSQVLEQVHYAKFNLKRNGERINMQKLYFPLCHPSFLKRLVFKLREETPDVNDEWPWGYGNTSNDYVIRKIIDLKENDIVICQPQEMGVCGHDIIDDANSMFEYINNFTNENIKLEHVKRLRKL